MHAGSGRLISAGLNFVGRGQESLLRHDDTLYQHPEKNGSGIVQLNRNKLE
jgi:hypothetical protein